MIQVIGYPESWRTGINTKWFSSKGIRGPRYVKSAAAIAICQMTFGEVKVFSPDTNTRQKAYCVR
jgi:hypothetical protein